MKSKTVVRIYPDIAAPAIAVMSFISFLLAAAFGGSSLEERRNALFVASLCAFWLYDELGRKKLIAVRVPSGKD